MRACRLRRRDQVARPFAADARILRAGRRELSFVEFARKIGELMDDDHRLRGKDRSRQRRRVEHVDDSGHHPARSSILAVSA